MAGVATTAGVVTVKTDSGTEAGAPRAAPPDVGVGADAAATGPAVANNETAATTDIQPSGRINRGPMDFPPFDRHDDRD